MNTIVYNVRYHILHLEYFFKFEMYPNEILQCIFSLEIQF